MESKEIERYVAQSDGVDAFLVWDKTGTTLLASQAERVFPGASVIKLAILGCLADQIEKQALSWGQEYVVQASDVVGGAGVLPLLRRRAYTLEELAGLMIAVSDNTASNILGRLLGMDTINCWLRNQGCSRSALQRWFMEGSTQEEEWGRRLTDWFANPTGPENRLTVEDTRNMLCYLGPKGPLSKVQQRKCWAMLRGQQFIEKLQGDLPAGWSAAHKTGELPCFRMDAGWLLWHEAPVLGVAIFVHHPTWSPREFDGFMARLGRMVVDCWGEDMKGCAL